MLALIFTRKLRPMIIGSSSGCLMLAGMIARPRGDLAAHELGRDVLAQGDEAHLLGDHAAPRVVHLRYVAVAAAASRSLIHAARRLGKPCARVDAFGPLVS